MSTEVEIEVIGHGLRGPLWRATCDGAVIVPSSVDPEHAAARALLARGIRGRMAVRHKGADHVASTWNIELAVGRAARETASGMIKIARWEAFDREAAE